jgi:hypothetical protein
MSFEIEPYTWQTGTRPCRFTLALDESSVLADFDVNPDGLISLLRVSFDGYGALHRILHQGIRCGPAEPY